MPKVTQNMHSGATLGVSVRYTCEKYFSTVCAIAAEFNYSNVGWDENIVDINNASVINTTTGKAEKYSRTLHYLQVPVFAHLGWGREEKGLQFFFQAGPQFGYFIGQSTNTNFTLSNYNSKDRSNSNVAQDTMSVENKIDYGIAVGLGLEYSNRHLGHFLLEGRYYYGLGNIYGDSKRDYFSKSNIGNIVIKLTYLFDIIKTNNVKIK